MESRFKGHSEIELAWRENLDQIELQGRQLLRRVMEQAKRELDKQFTAALKRGEVLQLHAGQDDLRALMFAAAKRELGPARKPKALPEGDD